MFGQKMIVFFPKHRKPLFSDIISVKNSDKTNFHFWTKSWTNPFGKCPFFGSFKNFNFFHLKSFFSFQNKKNDVF